MKNLESRLIEANAEAAMAALFTKANTEGQKAKALSVSIRLNALAIHIAKKELPTSDVVALLMKEALRFEGEAEALH
ncbi:DUF2732 domain-containing protein [Erwinia rhapontici]|uniref:DUF2732 family protein n=1 Tax=Erwinia rhapontici TaxID=55212 RepID=UPI001D0DB6A4|nr:DUF2732 family protein [Erwinia rhapontici]UDQ80171.1 DUF2732 domain-containing protein [Erwinia rhapontici]